MKYEVTQTFPKGVHGTVIDDTTVNFVQVK